MKKLIFGFIALLAFNAGTMAQAVKATVTAPSVSVKVAPPTARVVSISKPTVAANKPAAHKGAVVLKKDGSPDKRYNNANAPGQLKKDGTPDMR